jgi:flagellar biosynthesis protein FliR
MSALEAACRALFGADLARVAPVLALVAARTLPLGLAAPWLGFRGVASSVRLAAALVLALAMTPIALGSTPALPSSGLALVLLALREALVGAAFAVASSVPIAAFGWAGALLDRWRSGAETGAGRDLGRGHGPLTTLHGWVAVVLFALVGGLRVAVGALGDSFVAVPVGAREVAELGAFALGAARLVTSALELAVALAAPAIVALLLVELALGVAGRVAPTLRPWAVRVPLSAGLGLALALLGVAAALPRLPETFARSIEQAAALVRELGG